MLDAADIRDRMPPAGKSQVDNELAEDISKLNREWREKRDSLRNAKKDSSEHELLATGAATAATASAPAPERKELRPSETANDNGLSEAAATGRLDDCQRILTYTRPNVWGLDGTTPLFAAALWDQPDIVRLLLSAAADPGQQNRSGRRPTALHAASLQENGKICMMLLGAKADPHSKDDVSVAPIDYASCSEAVWPHFAGTGCTRISKEDLVVKGVIRKASTNLEQELQALDSDRASTVATATACSTPCTTGIISEFSRPGSAYVLTSKHPPRPGSAATGNRPGSRSGSRNGRRPSNSPIDILAEGDEGAETRTGSGAPPSSRTRSGYAGGIPALPPSASGNAAAPGSMRSLGL